MFSKDYLVRQLQQFVQALAMVLLNKRQGQAAMAQSIIHNTMMDVLGLSLDQVRDLDREALVSLVSAEGTLRPDVAIAAADLLAEDERPEGRLRAAWLYEAALQAGAAVPHDVHDRIAHLRGQADDDRG